MHVNAYVDLLSDHTCEEVLSLGFVMVEGVRGWWVALIAQFQAWHTGNARKCTSTSSFTKLQGWLQVIDEVTRLRRQSQV